MSRRLPPLNALRAFEAAARHESFSKAADELSVTHAAVSRHIRDLEVWLGVELFVRTGRGVKLTELGARYGRGMTPLFDRLGRLTAAVTAEGRAPRVSVSVEVAFASWWLVPRLSRFTEQNPRIEIDIDASDDLIDFRSTTIDVAIRYAAPIRAKWPGTSVRELVPLVGFPVCSPKLLKRSKVRTPHDLAGQVLLHEESKQWWSDWLQAAGAPEINASAGPMFRGFLALEAAESGQGFALADNVVAALGLQEGWLVKPFARTIAEGSYYIVSRADEPMSPAAKSIVAWIEQEMRDSQQEIASLLTPGGAAA